MRTPTALLLAGLLGVSAGLSSVVRADEPPQDQDHRPPSEHRDVPSPREHQGAPTPNEHRDVPSPRDHQGMPIPREHQGVPTPKEHQGPMPLHRDIPSPRERQGLSFLRDHRDMPPPHVVHHDGWRGDIRLFRDHDEPRWRGGSWFHGTHGDRDGWWWRVGGLWYFYTMPVYPYPDPYTPGIVVIGAPPAPPPESPTYVYACANPAGYYPYVVQCFGPWQRMSVDSAVSSVSVFSPPDMNASDHVVVSPPGVLTLPTTSEGDPQRATDDRRLNELAVAFQSITPQAVGARRLLTSLEQQVVDFQRSLRGRTYNATDIAQDARDLQDRIHAQIVRPSAHRP